MDQVRPEVVHVFTDDVGHRQLHREVAAVEMLDRRYPQHIGRVLRALKLRRDDPDLVPLAAAGVFQRFHRSRHAADMGEVGVGEHRDFHRAWS